MSSPDPLFDTTPRDRLDARIGHARESWTAEDLIRLAREEEVLLVSLMHVGGDGWLKTLDFRPRDEDHLRRILLGGERADGSSLFPGAGIPAGASDVVLTPRPSTAFLDPFAAMPTLVVLCGHADPRGVPLPQSPDTIVRRAHERLGAETGARLLAHGEIEFFLGKRADDSDAYGASERGYHAASPFVFGEALRREALVRLDEIGLPVKYGHSEVGYVEPVEPHGVIWEQHEIELDLLPLPEAADAIVLAQWVLRNLAHEYGLRCNTDAMIAQDHAGNGLHIHFAPQQPGEIATSLDAAGELTAEARRLIGGLVEMGGALMAFGNRGAASFARLRAGRETPKSIYWAEYDRSALIRLPSRPRTADGESVGAATVEFRLPDGSAHPHLLLAGAAQALQRGRSLPDLDALLERTARPNDGDGAITLPRDFPEIATALARERASLEAGDVFPPTMLDAIIEQLGGAASK